MCGATVAGVFCRCLWRAAAGRGDSARGDGRGGGAGRGAGERGVWVDMARPRTSACPPSFDLTGRPTLRCRRYVCTALTQWCMRYGRRAERGARGGGGGGARLQLDCSTVTWLVFVAAGASPRTLARLAICGLFSPPLRICTTLDEGLSIHIKTHRDLLRVSTGPSSSIAGANSAHLWSGRGFVAECGPCWGRPSWIASVCFGRRFGATR